jgi:hypothetical protein
LIDPRAKNRHLLRRQLLTLFWHHTVGIESGDHRHDETLGAFPRHGRHASLPALHIVLPRFEAEQTLVLPATMALHATRLKDRLDVAREIHRPSRRSWQERELFRRQGGLRHRRTNGHEHDDNRRKGAAD